MLTEKEIKVLELKKKGLKQKEIAAKLKISQPAVSLFERSIKKKIGESVEILSLLKERGIKLNKKDGELEF